MLKNVKRKVCVFSAIAGISVLAVAIGGIYLWKKATYDPVLAELDGEPITLAEYELFIDEARSEVLDEVLALDDTILVDDSFWSSPLKDGRIPGEMLREKALEAAKTKKAIQILYQEAGLLQDISHTAFMKDFKEENKRRKKAKANGEPVYGPVEMDALSYWENFVEHTEGTYQLTLQATSPLPDDSRLKQFYLAQRSQQPDWKEYDTITAQKVTLPYVYGENREEIRGLAERFAADFENMISALPAEATIVTETYTQGDNYSSDGSMVSDYEATWKLEEGQVSEVYDLRDAFVIYRCQSVQKGDYHPFEEVKDAVIELYYEQQRDTALASILEREFVINSDLWDTLVY